LRPILTWLRNICAVKRPALGPNHLANGHSESIKKNWQNSAAAAGSVQLVGRQCVTAIEI
jgi:hypothetical protein